ncbi:EAL domain-containing protein [Leeia sp. TBRC 13508]|uniref:EAL domain-containing protein n=1 Tax=Leeia speluncae TaxID=2884804 RepID=A0ABS8DBE0_9NEIS|nr:EAL domain-containing protein [Leeia speluncae]MCB6184938.1 EAL domain-containing protein [Leeia speluncae]
MDIPLLLPLANKRYKRRIAFIISMLLLVVLVVSTTASIIWRLRNDTIDRQVALDNLTARAMEDQLTQSLTIVERTLTLAGTDPKNGERLSFYLQQAPYLRSISIIDAQHRITHSTTQSNVGIQIDNTDYMPFSDDPVPVLRSGKLLGGRDFADSRPINWDGKDDTDISFIPVSLDVPQPNGHWHTVIATINPDYFLNFYLSHLSSEQGQVLLLRYDGTPLIQSHQRITSQVFTQALKKRLKVSEVDNYTDVAPNGEQLLTSYRASRSYPYILVVRANRASVLAAWRQEAITSSIIVGIVLLLTLGTAIFFFFRMEKLERIRQQDEHQLNIAAAAFETQQGIIVTDSETNVLRVNPAFTEITGYSAEEMIGKTPRILSSGKHNLPFYQAMWKQIVETGFWSGEIWNRRKTGEVYPEWLTITAIKNSSAIVSHYVATLTDITQRKEAEEEIRHLAYYDPLTKLPNRRLLLEKLQEAVNSDNHQHMIGALLFIDLDNFKQLNDTLGHDYGDLLLQEVGIRLNQNLQVGDTVARLGGDEFILILNHLSHDYHNAVKRAEAIGEHFRITLNQPYHLAEHEYITTPSIGIAMFGKSDITADELLKHADLALYSAKSSGRNAVSFFDLTMQTNLTERTNLEAALRQGIAQDQLKLYIQPQMKQDCTVYGGEVLVRWQHPTLGLLSPDKFIPLAEETDLIIPMGNWVLTAACKLLKQFSQDEHLKHFSLSVNVSVKQLHLADFVEQVQSTLLETGAPASQLMLEITESGLIDNMADSIRKMERLTKLGVRFSLDDFGTGYSSLSYLKKLPLTQVKIDQSFVRGIHFDANDAAIVRSIIALASAMHLQVTAEGVENREQLEYLQALGCDSYQGYLLGRPAPWQSVIQQLRDCHFKLLTAENNPSTV